MSRRKPRLFIPGAVVEVRSAAEIVATLDADGRLDGLPFMPEMLAFCGQRFRVSRRIHKICDTITHGNLRGLDRAVALEALRCDGAAHGGCQSGCLLIWKEAWLRSASDRAGGEMAHGAPGELQSAVSTDAAGWLRERTCIKCHNEVRYRCQATELYNATYPLSPLDPRQYLCDVRMNGAGWLGLSRVFLRVLVNRLLRLLRLPTTPRVSGALRRTPHVDTGLRPGDWVEVRSHAEILATLDVNGRNRGMTFEAEMVHYCGRRFRVLRRVDAIVDETNGKFKSLVGPCLVLEGVVCTGTSHRLCARGAYAYWREAWLRRVAPPAGEQPLPAGDQAPLAEASPADVVGACFEPCDLLRLATKSESYQP